MLDRVRSWLGRGLVAVGAGLLSFWLWVALDSSVFQARLARRLASVAGSVSIDGPPSASPLQAGRASRREAESSGLVGRIEIPRLGYSALIVEGVGSRSLRRGVGHVPGSAFPGEPGNVALAGHRDTYFRTLRDVAQGDAIRLRTPDGLFAYEVDSIAVVGPDRRDLLLATDRPTLTLVTCYPFTYVGPAPMRFVVRARERRAVVHAS